MMFFTSADITADADDMLIASRLLGYIAFSDDASFE